MTMMLDRGNGDDWPRLESQGGLSKLPLFVQVLGKAKQTEASLNPPDSDLAGAGV